MITLEDIRRAQRRVRGVALHTPLVPCPRGEEGRVLYLKAENLQPTGAFKLRGAYNKISSLLPDERSRGVVAHSSGNHAQAVAYAARSLGVRAVIVMPRGAARVKLDATAAFGLEILEDLPDVEAVLVPVSGGGLISGVAAALKLSRSDIRVIGVEPELAADARASLRSGKLVELPAEQVGRTIADGLRVRRLGDAPFEHVRAFVDDIVAVSEDEILEAMRRLALRVRLVAEPSGAVTFAAHLFHQAELPPTSLNVAIVSGGNVEPHLLARVLS